MKKKLILLLALVGAINLQLSSALAQGTAFTYQGRLNAGGNPANGLYDLQFTLFNAAANGAQVGGTVTNLAVGVTNGLFTTTVDFGNVYDGTSLWLQIGVETNGADGNFTILCMPQPLSPVPYAIYSTSAGHSSSAGMATTANGVSAGAVTAVGIASGQVVKNLDGLTDGVTLAPGANVTITPSGNTLTIASTAGGGGGGSNSWSLTGNSGTSPAIGNFVGTLDNQPLELHANGQRVLRLEPGGGLPNVIGGTADNAVTGGATGATISGGAQNFVSATYGTVGGGTANMASAPGAFVGGGGYDGDYISGNTASGAAATVAGGEGNAAGQAYGMVGGGLNNRSGPFGFVGGGSGNNSGGEYATVGGGEDNSVAGGYATLGGGEGNLASGPGAFVGGGGYDGNSYGGNTASGGAAAVGGGLDNQATGAESVVGGGANNVATGVVATVAGGENNAAGYDFSTVGGGQGNTASNLSSVVSGGDLNTASGQFSTVGGGSQNLASGDYSVVAGGGFDYGGNTASGPSATVGGGFGNGASGAGSVVGGGKGNTASGGLSTVGGGEDNTASKNYTGDSTVGGGGGNTASGDESTVGGGYRNTASGDLSTVGGGQENLASGNLSTVGGGFGNLASGKCSTVGGGNANAASGEVSFAAGNSANATNQGAFVWADSQNATFSSTANDQFCIRAQGGVRLDNSTSIVFGSQPREMLELYRDPTSTYIYGLGVQTATFYTRTAINGGFAWYQGGLYNGNQNNAGGGNIMMTLDASGNLRTTTGTIASLSDRNAKADFSPVNPQEVLARVSALPMTTWRYKTAAVSQRHIGPMAQDFHAAFNVGLDDKSICVVDEGGVALAAIQGLNQKVDEKEGRIQEQAAEIQELKQSVAELKQLVQSLRIH